MEDDFRLLLATVYGEAGNSSETAWRGVAWVIMNRRGKREWRAFPDVAGVIKNTGFDAYTQRTAQFRHADDYLSARPEAGGNDRVIERMIRVLRPVYDGAETDPTSNAVLYYSPKAQAALHQRNPAMYRERPPWNFDLLREVDFGLAGTDDFKFYCYR